MSFEIMTRCIEVVSQIDGISPQNVATLCGTVYDFVLGKGPTSSPEDIQKRENAFSSLSCALRANSVGEENLTTTAELIYGTFDGKDDPVSV